MRQTSIFTLLGPAVVLYLIAAAAASAGGLDVGDACVAVAAGALALAMPAMRRKPARGATRVGWLGLCLGLSLVRDAAPSALLWSLDVAEVLGCAGAGALLIDLALNAPDRLVSGARGRVLGGLAYSVALLAALAALLAEGPAWRLFGDSFVVPSTAEHACRLWLALATVAALALRSMRGRLGSTPDALASNGWASLVLWPSSVWLVIEAGVALGVSEPLAPSLRRACGVAVALLLLWGHVRLVDPEQRLRAGATTRRLVGLTLSVAAAAAAGLWVAPWLPMEPGVHAAWLVGCLLLAVGLNRALRPLARRALAPASGQLLDALEQARAELARVHRFDDVASVVLGAARRASGAQDSEPLLYGFDPPREARIDLAGQVHVFERGPHPEIMARLNQVPGEFILRGPLEAEIVRSPPLRPLIHALIEVDALCVLPLRIDDDSEGALIVPRGRRRGALNLEELQALRDFSRFVASFLNVLNTHARAQQRVTAALNDVKTVSEQLVRAEQGNTRLRAAVQILQTGAGPTTGIGPAYSSPMRGLMARVEAERARMGALWLDAEPGCDVVSVGRALHGTSTGPFVIGDGALPAQEHCMDALFGGDGRPGWLELAAGGTLLLQNVPALPLEVQRALGEALAFGQLAQTEARSSRPLEARVLLSARVPLERLRAQGRIEPRLAERLQDAVIEVPALRERREDLPSLVLLALDRAARVQARPSIGIDPEAQATLMAHPWPGNHEELQAVVESAVRNARSNRVTLRDLPLPLGLPLAGLDAVPSEQDPLEGTLELVERRVLVHALAKAHGNKSEAARSLGLKRSTFLDKLRRHGVEAPEGSTPSQAPRPRSSWPG